MIDECEHRDFSLSRVTLVASEFIFYSGCDIYPGLFPLCRGMLY